MLAILHSLGMFVADLLKSRCLLEAENLFLRYQLSIALRRAPPRLRLRGRKGVLEGFVERLFLAPMLIAIAIVLMRFAFRIGNHFGFSAGADDDGIRRKFWCLDRRAVSLSFASSGCRTTHSWRHVHRQFSHPLRGFQANARQRRWSFHHSDAVLHRLLHLLETTHAYLAHALARYAELVRELLERDRFFGEPARLEDAPLSVVERGARQRQAERAA